VKLSFERSLSWLSQMLVLLVLFAAGYIIYSLTPELETLGWVRRPCQVLGYRNSSREFLGVFDAQMEPVYTFSYTYQYAGKVYTNSHLRRSKVFVSGAEFLRWRHRLITSGSNACFVRPSNPAEAVLARGFSPSTLELRIFMALEIPGFAAVIALIKVCASLLILLRAGHWLCLNYKAAPKRETRGSQRTNQM
jgi:hypothetical protein